MLKICVKNNYEKDVLIIDDAMLLILNLRVKRIFIKTKPTRTERAIRPVIE